MGLPIVLFLAASLVSGVAGEGGGDGGGGGEGGWAWGDWFNFEEGGKEEGRFQGLGQGFVYLWSLAVFGVLVWRGNRVLESSSNKDLGALVAALVVFANLAFVCLILLATGGGREEGGGEEEGSWLGSFSAVASLTFLLWIVFGVVFAILFYQKARKGRNENDGLL